MTTAPDRILIDPNVEALAWFDERRLVERIADQIDDDIPF